ncbi:hypothetical protein K8R33_02520 [archaeon]|nr:hypothetical protein [archaeon]
MGANLFKWDEGNNIVKLLLFAKHPLDIRDFEVPELEVPDHYLTLTSCFSNDPSISRKEVGLYCKEC